MAFSANPSTLEWSRDPDWERISGKNEGRSTNKKNRIQKLEIEN